MYNDERRRVGTRKDRTLARLESVPTPLLSEPEKTGRWRVGKKYGLTNSTLLHLIKSMTRRLVGWIKQRVSTKTTD